jgi:hypothetical protein
MRGLLTAKEGSMYPRPDICAREIGEVVCATFLYDSTARPPLPAPFLVKWVRFLYILKRLHNKLAVEPMLFARPLITDILPGLTITLFFQTYQMLTAAS